MEDCKQKLKEKEDEINILKRNVTEMNTKCMKIQNENATLSNDIKQLSIALNMAHDTHTGLSKANEIVA